jgi:hypothetical protein
MKGEKGRMKKGFREMSCDKESKKDCEGNKEK